MLAVKVDKIKDVRVQLFNGRLVAMLISLDVTIIT